MAKVLKTSPAGILDRRSFLETCMAYGMNENTFSVYSTYSCVLEHVGVDIWKLRGVDVDPASVEALRFANHIRPREKRMRGYGWTKDGKLWITASIPRFGKNSLVIGCPGSVKRYLIGQTFAAMTKRNQPCGTVAINGQGSSYGYGPFIRRFGLDESDILIAEFDLSTNTVMLDVGDESVPDQTGLYRISSG